MKRAIKTKRQEEQQTNKQGLNGVSYPPASLIVQLKDEATNDYVNRNKPVLQSKSTNKTGLPDKLKSGIEKLSGYSMDDVRVHRNSSKPAQLQAYAYAQGTDIHLGPGQERHLPHEAWHVVQQKQGRVKPTLQMKTGHLVNDNEGLEKEADVMGERIIQKNEYAFRENLNTNPAVNTPIIQRAQVTEPAAIEMREVNTLQTIINKLPTLNIGTELEAFGLKNAAIVSALKTAKNKETARRTIAIFQYLATHGAVLSELISFKFQRLGDETQSKVEYLQEMNHLLSRKLTRGLWMGDEDRGMIVLGARSAANFFVSGKIELIKKVNEAAESKISVAALLDDHSHNNEAKSYGRLLQSMIDLKLSDIKQEGADITPPKVDEKIRHDRVGFKYFLSDYQTNIQASELENNKDYVLMIKGGRSCGVTVKENKDGVIVFSTVEF